ncbi:MAG: phosphoribosylformylglycinamidine cyclo-ligase [Oscillospiraceae bacterium]|jgi:phosphoribosylformylglycinamidine cyclo-ligase|nr:phosphoribosylformylglycinamidine cyclo-ligase [Oscillospiraceae bacterium]
MSNKDIGAANELYASAGVDITAGYRQLELIKPMLKSTYRDGVLGAVGGFGGLFEPNFKGMKRPVFVSGTDGVGTKLKLAFLMDKHDTVGIDCVAMCVNDIICSGAEPLFFLDYMAVGKNIPERAAAIVSGVAEGCREAGCALIGGETAEHPGLMPEDEYDIAGFAVGLVDFDDMLDEKNVSPGDAVIALPSSGLHSNGFSLVRKLFSPTAASLAEYIPELGKTLGEELLTPTRIYVKTLLGLLREFPLAISGAAHITGGGIYENAPRCLPEGVRMILDVKKLKKPPIFDLVASKAAKNGAAERDMYNTFNMGAGMLLTARGDRADELLRSLRARGEDAVIVGECVSGEKGIEIV